MEGRHISGPYRLLLALAVAGLALTGGASCTGQEDPGDVAVRFYSAYLTGDHDTIMKHAYIEQSALHSEAAMQEFTGFMNEIAGKAQERIGRYGGLAGVRATGVEKLEPFDGKEWTQVSLEITAQDGSVHQAKVRMCHATDMWKVQLGSEF